ncbi:hypothetical protein AB6A40_011745 [Gnathostoma spinigerum]|uniref:Uncharacterized protein n=1 Tax=Gnathostoma spinigerum TaxID=75299 RepID=A0ABD6EZW9_9BILA
MAPNSSLLSVSSSRKSHEIVEVNAHERSILDRSYAAAVAASRQSANCGHTVVSRRRATSGGPPPINCYESGGSNTIGSSATSQPKQVMSAPPSSAPPLSFEMLAERPWVRAISSMNIMGFLLCSLW